jgi:N-acetylglucosamine kinase-like BadF-type ATPase
MSLYLCVDCGGSKTSAVICSSSGEIVGRALGGPSNYAYSGNAVFIQAVNEAVSNALKTCISPPSIDPVDLSQKPSLFASAWFGISGVDSPSAAASAATALSELLKIPKGPKLVVANDTHLLAAPLRLHADINHAIAVIAGTGSICVSFLQTPQGTFEELARVGGWGWILGDEGGGFHVGREAVRQLLVDTDKTSLGGPALPHSVLKKRILERFRVNTALDILTEIHLPDPTPSAVYPPNTPGHLLVAREKRLSELSPLVFEAAFGDGDPFALNVLQLCAQALASHIQILLRSPNKSLEHAPKSVSASESVICFGGSLVGIGKYRDMILDALKDERMGGHVFKYVEYVDDAAKIGAEGLAPGGTAGKGES